MKNLTNIVLFFAMLMLFTGCANTNFDAMADVTVKQKSTNKNSPLISTQSKDLNLIISDLANQLKANTTIDFKNDKGTVAVTSFVNLDNLSQTSQFGRLLSESMLNELFSRNFFVSDFRGRGVIYVNQNGEFYITRKMTNLQTEVPNTYVLVGTYSKLGVNTFLNVRILDNDTGKIVASARAIYNKDYCKLSDNMCNEDTKKMIKIIGKDI